MLRPLAFVLFLAAPMHTALAQTCNGLPATIVGTAADDDLEGTDGADVIVGRQGNDRIVGLGGDDVICGGTGDDDLFGGDGDDSLFGDRGNDTLQGGDGTDLCDGVRDIDVADTACESARNTDVDVLPVRLSADDGTPLDGALYVPGGAAAAGGIRQVAIIISHGAMGSFASSVPKIVGMQGSPLGFTVLALNRRDAGEDSGGGTVIFEDATLDLGVGIELLAKLGFREIFVTGHSQGTQNAAIYPSFAMDERVVAVGLFGTVDDGRNTAKEVLFVFPPDLYEQHVATAESLVAEGRGDEVVAFSTVFGVDLFRSGRNFLSFWGPDTLSVVQREIATLDVPVLLMRADGDEFTPDEMSRNVIAGAEAAGVDATYIVLDYPFPAGANGGNAHGFVAVERELITTTLDWLRSRVPAADMRTKAIMIPAENPPGNREPIADAGDPASGKGATTVQLDGADSLDIDGEIVSYSWAQLSGDGAGLSSPSSRSPTVQLPLSEQTLEFQLTVTDDAGGSSTATVSVAVTSSADLPGGSSALGPLGLSLLMLICAGQWLARRRDWRGAGR